MNARWVGTALLGFAVATASVVFAARGEEKEMKFSECPEAVQKTLHAEGKGVKIETVTKETFDDGKVVYWADVVLGGKPYEIAVDPEGTLTEMSLEVGEDQVEFSKCPGPVQATFHKESNDAKVETLDKDMKYGVTIYEGVVSIKGKEYEIIVAEDGTLLEKTLVVVEDDVELSKCPAAVQKTLHEHAGGGKIVAITRSTGIGAGRHTYEAEVDIQGKGYAIEVAENGMLLSKSLEEAD
jgi:hypothetical protein